MDIDKLLDRIFEIIASYQNGEYKDIYKEHRDLVCNLSYLSREQVKAHQEHNKQYYLSKEKTNAGKEREADKKVPELYMCRKILEHAKGISIAMGYEIKMN